MIDEKTDDFEILSEEEIALMEIEDLESADVFQETAAAISEIAEKIAETTSSVPFFLRLTRRGVVFLTLFLLSLLSLFGIGNYQGFLDSNLKMLLLFSTICAIMLSIFSAAAVLESLLCIFIKQKIRYFFYAIAFLFPLVFALSFGTIARILNLLASGFQY